MPNLPERLALPRRPLADLTTRDLHAGDRLVLCSDGLSAVVPGELVHATHRQPRIRR
jgi:hypothetical protein